MEHLSSNYDDGDESCEEVSEEIQFESDAENIFEMDHLKEIIVGVKNLKTTSHGGNKFKIK